MSEATSAGATEKPKAEEGLARMSFGDHLEELRSRIFKAVGAVLLGVLVLMPFKRTVTEVYIAPYRKCWHLQYEKFVAGLDAKIGLVGRYEDLDAEHKKAVDAKFAGLHPLERSQIEFHRTYRGEIERGDFPPSLVGTIETQGNFPLSYNLKATGGLDDIWIFMTASMLFGLILASPVVLWQIWAFIGAGLYRNEKKVVWTYVPFGVSLLAAGVLFGYFLAVPYGYFMLVDYMQLDQVGPMFTVSHYFSFFFSFCSALGLVFQLPLVMLILAKLDIVRHDTMRKQWRYFVLAIFAIAMLVTPPDPFSMCLMATPMILLYLLGLVLTGIVSRKAATTAVATS